MNAFLDIRNCEKRKKAYYTNNIVNGFQILVLTSGMRAESASNVIIQDRKII